MSNRPNTRHRGATRPRGTRPRHGALLVTVVAVVVAVAVALAGSLSNDSGGPDAEAARRSDAPVQTGERNAMGMPVVATPGAASGTTAAGGVEVEGANWDLGRAPLNVAVRPSWTLRNTSTSPVTLGAPRSEVRQGCCPGPFTVLDATLAPGESTEVTFELSMHKGMDGPHDLGVHIPVTGPAGEAHLTLSVSGDFR